jgi:hypothetical protein
MGGQKVVYESMMSSRKNRGQSKSCEKSMMERAARRNGVSCDKPGIAVILEQSTGWKNTSVELDQGVEIDSTDQGL